MFYPQWHVPYFGGGLMIALVATLHVYIAQFAVGAGLWVAWTEWRIARRPDPALEEFLRRFARVIVLGAFVMGAVTGVGIWFTIGLASPRATSILISNFVWAWAIEWVLFAVEIAAGYAYYFGFDRLGSLRRRWTATIYAAASWGSMAVVNAILTFMLTPGRWTESGDFWDGLFNATMIPSLALRTLGSIAMAGAALTLIAVASQASDAESKRRTADGAARWLALLWLMLPAGLWYLAASPTQGLAYLNGGAPAMLRALETGAVAIVFLAAYGTWRWAAGRNTALPAPRVAAALALLGLAAVATAGLETVREGIRKPYLIYDYLYSNGWELNEKAQLNSGGVTPASPWLMEDIPEHSANALGRRVWAAECSACHNEGGVNDLAPKIKNWDKARLARELPVIHERMPFMPPIVGTPEERAALIDYLVEINNK